MARTLSVEIIGDARSLNRALNSTQNTTKGFAKNVGNMGKVAVGAAGAAGIGALVYGLKTGISEFNESQKVTAATTSVLKSMGHTAGVTAKDVGHLATSIMKKTGIDDEAIQSGENLLLTFRNIQNRVGKNNDVFNQATKIMTDFSVRFGKDIPQSAVLVGKALNDPIKGLTALGRVGVQFTDQQKAQIKAMVKSGDTMGAQKVIMAELTAETKGAAEAQGKTLGGQINIARESFNNFAGMLVAKAIPILKQAISWLRDHWPQISAAIKAWWDSIRPIWVAFGTLVGTVVGLVRKHWGTIGPILEQVLVIVRRVFTQIGNIIRLFTDLLRGDWSKVWQDLKAIASTALAQLRDIIKLAVTVIFKVAKALGEEIWKGVKAGLSAGLGLLKDSVTGLFHKVIDWAKSALGISSPSTVFHEIGLNVVKGFAGGIGAGAGLLKKAVISIAKSVGGSILGGIEGIIPGGGGGGGGGGIVKLGKWLQGMGFQVGEHPAFGGVSEGHAGGDYGAPPNDHRSNHYKGRAIDVNWPGGGSGELRRLQGVFGAIKAWHPIEEMIEDAGSSNQHLHVALAKGGIVTRPTRALIGERGPEAVIPLGRNGGSAMAMVNLNVDGKTLAKILIDPLRAEAKIVSQRTGRPAFG